MSDPYETLGLTPDAGEVEIRRRYLELVRQFPPDRAPERFTAIHAAYEALRDPARRLQAQIFECETTVDSVETLAADLRRRLRDARLPVATLLNLADAP
ncbi:MAG: J domain-containing protein [Isosphaeraceae bacterium]